MCVCACALGTFAFHHPAFFDFDHTLEFSQNFIFLGIIIMRYMIWTYPIRSTMQVTADDITVSAIACSGTSWLSYTIIAASAK